MVLPDSVLTPDGKELGKLLVFNGAPYFFCRNHEALEQLRSMHTDLVLRNEDAGVDDRYIGADALKQRIAKYVFDQEPERKEPARY